jgi:hypothetical protein
VLNIFDFLDFVVSSGRNQRLLARIVLNAMGFSNEYPVDLAELRTLSAHNYALVSAFLTWAVAHPGYIRSLRDWPKLTAMADGRTIVRPYKVSAFITADCAEAAALAAD